MSDCRLAVLTLVLSTSLDGGLRERQANPRLCMDTVSGLTVQVWRSCGLDVVDVGVS